MENNQIKDEQYQFHKSEKGFLIGQAVLRILAIAAALIAIGLMVTNNQTTEYIGIQIEAKYSYMSAFKYFVTVNILSCVFSLLSLVFIFLFFARLAKPDRKKYFLLFLNDLILTVFAVSGCAAASAAGFLGRYGNDHTGWMPVCDHFGKFCNRTMASIGFSFVATVLFIVLTAWSAWRSATVQLSTY